MPVKVFNQYKNWKPVKHRIIKDLDFANQIHEFGYKVIPFLNDNQLNKITKFYEDEHNLKEKAGGLFYSLYSKDLSYRKRVHETLGNILKPTLDQHFRNYKNVVNTFITKVPGPESEFYVHQDTTALDEYLFSPLSIWIPLQDITPNNGALGVIEKTHWFFSPYRGISFSQPFQDISDKIRSYLKPIYLKAGEALVFDPRIIHNSMLNSSNKNRVVALSGLFPKEAEFITCFKEKEIDSKIELLQHDDRFILENENFYYDCHSRPKTGLNIKEIDVGFPVMNADTFEKLCLANDIPKPNEIEKNDFKCQMIAEPNGSNFISGIDKTMLKERNIWKKIKSLFN